MSELKLRPPKKGHPAESKMARSRPGRDKFRRRYKGETGPPESTAATKARNTAMNGCATRTKGARHGRRPLQKPKMPGFPTPTNVVGVNANRRDPHKSGESPALHEE
jgi:hypothetical protein